MTARALQAEAVFDVLGLGCVAVDDLLCVPSYPTPDTKMRVTRRERQCGGLTATALVAAARFGARCAFAGILGPDADSEFVADSLRREGIDLTYLQRRPDARPIRSTIIVDESSHTRTILFDLAGTVGAAPDWPPEPAVCSTRVLYVDHYGIEGMIRAARVAHPAGVAVVADLERNEWPGFDELLGLVDHLIVGHELAHRLTGTNDPVAAIDHMWTSARQLVAVTGGAAGCWFRTACQAETRHQPAYRIETVDTTGCGDVFHGTYAAALAAGHGPAERIRYATAAAALKATHTGGQVGIPTRAAVEHFLQQRA